MAKFLPLPAMVTVISGAVVTRENTSVTPVEKVITLLSDLLDKSKAEAAAEAATYTTFAAFCKEKSELFGESITSGRDNINLLSAEIAEKTATTAEKKSELAKTVGTKEKLTKDLQDTTVRCEKEHAAYNADDADTTKALTALQNAIKAMESSKPASAAAGLLAMRAKIEKSPAFKEAMQVMDAGVKWASFLQVDPSDPEFKFHSQGIIDLLNKLLDEFTAKKADRDDEWNKTNKNCIETKENLNDEIGNAAAEIDRLTKEIDDLTTRIAEARGELVEADATLKDDKLYITDLTKLCETRANEFDQRSQMRADEIKALTAALDILQEKVAGADEAANVRAMLLQKTGLKSQPVAFFQEMQMSTKVHVQNNDAATAEQGVQQRDAVLQFLGSEGRRLKSMTLLSLVTRAGADPFKKVKELIHKLIERLVTEATAEATKKGFCDTEMAKAETDRNHRYADTRQLASQIGELEAKFDSLTQEMGELKEGISELRDTLKEMTEDRQAEKAENLDTLKEAKGGLGAVTDAIEILKTFYKNAAKANVFLEASPVDEDNPGAASGAYKGDQTASKGIIGLLEVIKSDFQHTIETVSAQEKKAQAAFVESDRLNKMNTKRKETKLKLDSEDLAETIATLASKHADLKTNQDLLDGALRELVELQPTCVDTGMSYEERVKKREEEIEALKRAHDMLLPGN